MPRRTLLLVEDSSDDETLMMRALEKSRIDCDVTIARDGAEALELLGLSGAGTSPVLDPVVVVLDLKMPKLDGFEVLKHIRAHPRTRLLPSVVFTSSAEPRDIERSYGLGASSYVRKPVDFGKFSDTVTRMVHYWLTVNQPPPSDNGSDAFHHQVK